MLRLSLSRGFALVALGLALAAPAAADEPKGADERLEALERRVEEQQKENKELKRRLSEVERREAAREEADAAGAAVTGTASALDHGSLPDRASKALDRQGLYGGIYAKPFLKRMGRAYLGGYMDFEWRDQEGTDSTFRLPRFIPFIYADVTEQIKVAAEIEFEFGGVGGNVEGEVKLEFAFVDFVFSDAIAARAGAILVPLGKFNLIHDSPVNDLTDRPLVDRFVIPTTFTEPGAGFYGSFYPGEWKIDYEIYAVNGFRGLERDAAAPTGFTSNITDQRGLRDAESNLEQDLNDTPAGVGRLGLSPFLGLEFGVSGHVGTYDDDGDGHLLAQVYAVDLTVQLARFSSALAGLEVLGEAAAARFERDADARAAGVPDGLWGAYAQVNYHFMPAFLRKLAPVAFGPESTFTAVCRLDHVDLDGRQLGRVNPGLNFRPVEDTVLKVDYQFNFEDGEHRRVDDDALLVSVATYF